MTNSGNLDFLDAILVNPSVCFDVRQGDNGAYRAGPGRDDVTGLGVVDFGLLAAKLGTPAPPVAPPAPPAPPAPSPEPPSPAGRHVTVRFTGAAYESLEAWSQERHVRGNKAAAIDWQSGQAVGVGFRSATGRESRHPFGQASTP